MGSQAQSWLQGKKGGTADRAGSLGRQQACSQPGSWEGAPGQTPRQPCPESRRFVCRGPRLCSQGCWPRLLRRHSAPRALQAQPAASSMEDFISKMPATLEISLESTKAFSVSADSL